MIMDNPNFFYLNIGNRWPKFDLSDLEIAEDGALQLRALPRMVGQLPPNLSDLPTPQAPSGIARTGDGAIFFTEPDRHRLWRINACDIERKAKPAACIGGEGNDATQFRFPRGLLFLPGRGLLIADSCNNRIQVIDHINSQVLEIWNGDDAYGNPLLHEPWVMALDSENNVYVIVAGDHSLQKLDPWGRLDPGFRRNIDASRALTAPVALARTIIDGEERVIVLDRARRALVIFDLNGRLQKTLPIEISQSPLTLAISRHAIYIGDNGDQYRNILVFDIPELMDEQLNFIGTAVGYHGPIAALFLDCHDVKDKECCEVEENSTSSKAAGFCDLLLLAGNGVAPIVLKEGRGHRTCGFAIAGPFDFRRRPVTWHRLQAIVEDLQPHAHLRFFFLFEESQTGEPPEMTSVTQGCSPPEETFQGWCGMPPDVTEGLFESFASDNCSRGKIAGNSITRPGRSLATSTYLWLGVKLSGDGTVSPRLHQIRVEFDYASYLPHLPALYSEDKTSRQFLLPLLSLYESFFMEQESAITNIPELFDPEGTPPEFLAWLAGWLAQDIKEEWSDERKRQVIAEAFAAYARRGTPAGLHRRLQLFAGIQAQLLEPLVNADLWSLGKTSTLDFDTTLAPAEAQGAVLGTTATLDRSHLITESEFGAPLFEDVAHRFSVVVYPNATGSARRLAEVKAIIERDKPAHTDYHICVVRPALRVGFQSTIGIDTVVGGPESATPLDESFTSGMVLAGTPPAKLGEGSQVGVNTQLN